MPEFGIANITRHAASSIRVSNHLPAWTGVRFKWKNEILAFAGDESGRVMEIENPWATQQAAVDLLNQIQFDAYLPFEAAEVILDPAVEMGDAVYVSDGMSMIYSMSYVIDDLFSCDIAAPADNEIDHEFPFSEPAELDKSDVENMIVESLDDPDSPIIGKLEDVLTDIDSLYTRGNDHVEITTDHLSLVTGYDPHADPEEDGSPAAGADGTTKLHIGYESSGQTQEGGEIVSPVIILGAGNSSGTNIGYIRKTTDGLEILYTANTGDQIGLKCTTDGRLVFLGGSSSTTISLDGGGQSGGASIAYDASSGVMTMRGGASGTLISLDGSAQGSNGKIQYSQGTGMTQISGFVQVLDSEAQLPAGHENMDVIFAVRDDE